ncbi:hypothetical protein HG530_009381 [Fusarium avenaceum]|nr:hypothetical protein HG530_009381 [Fusarium avenaceum]
MPAPWALDCHGHAARKICLAGAQYAIGVGHGLVESAGQVVVAAASAALNEHLAGWLTVVLVMLQGGLTAERLDGCFRGPSRRLGQRARNGRWEPFEESLPFVFGGTGGPTEDALVLAVDELSLLAVDETDAWGECPRPNALLAASLRFHFVVTVGSGSAVIGFGRTPGEAFVDSNGFIEFGPTGALLAVDGSSEDGWEWLSRVNKTAPSVETLSLIVQNLAVWCMHSILVTFVLRVVGHCTIITD